MLKSSSLGLCVYVIMSMCEHKYIRAKVQSVQQIKTRGPLPTLNNPTAISDTRVLALGGKVSIESVTGRGTGSLRRTGDGTIVRYLRYRSKQQRNQHSL